MPESRHLCVPKVCGCFSVGCTPATTHPHSGETHPACSLQSLVLRLAADASSAESISPQSLPYLLLLLTVRQTKCLHWWAPALGRLLLCVVVGMAVCPGITGAEDCQRGVSRQRPAWEGAGGRPSGAGPQSAAEVSAEGRRCPRTGWAPRGWGLRRREGEGALRWGARPALTPRESCWALAPPESCWAPSPSAQGPRTGDMDRRVTLWQAAQASTGSASMLHCFTNAKSIAAGGQAARPFWQSRAPHLLNVTR